LGNDTDNLTTGTVRLGGSGSLQFDKVDGAANTVFAGAYRTIDKTPLISKFKPWDQVGISCEVSASTNVAYVFARVGADASNYVEWRWDDASLRAGIMTFLTTDFGSGAVTGTGWSEIDLENVGNVYDWDYLAVGVAFDAEGNALANIRLQRLGIIPAAPEKALGGDAG
jgi:hypothetical protein